MSRPHGVRLGESPVVLDIGANIGLFTLFALHKWPDARVFSFEPVPDVFDVLRATPGICPAYGCTTSPWATQTSAGGSRTTRTTR